MKSIKITKIAAIGLMMGLFVGLGEATKSGIDERAAKIEITLSTLPKLNEMFEVDVKITGESGLEDFAYYFPTYEFVLKFAASPDSAIELFNKNEIYIPELRRHQVREFKCRMRIIELEPQVSVGVALYPIQDFKAGSSSRCRGGINLYLIDSLTGQYGTREQWLNRSIGVLGKYNNVEPQWFSEIDPTWAESNRKIAEEMRKFEPSLSDSEALCLHQDNYLLIINAIGDASATDSERIEHLLKEGWLNAQRSGAVGKEKWFKDFTEQNKGRWGGNSNLNFFRDNDSSDFSIDYSDISLEKERITTTFIGTWNYNEIFYL